MIHTHTHTYMELEIVTRHTNRQTDRHMNRHADREAGIVTDTRTERQTCTHSTAEPINTQLTVIAVVSRHLDAE
jgi:hypothetical protein